jgi:hypothetical protein
MVLKVEHQACSVCLVIFRLRIYKLQEAILCGLPPSFAASGVAETFRSSSPCAKAHLETKKLYRNAKSAATQSGFFSVLFGQQYPELLRQRGRADARMAAMPGPNRVIVSSLGILVPFQLPQSSALHQSERQSFLIDTGKLESGL